MAFLFLLILFRGLYLRRVSLIIAPNDSSISIAGWMFITPILMYPFFKEIADEALIFLYNNPYYIIIGLLKGVGFWGITYAGQTVRKTSNSSASFFGFICIGLIAIGNSAFGEELTVMQWVSVGILTLTGLYFTFRGHLSSQPIYVQLMFMLMIFIGCMFGMIDHYFLSHVNWYGLLLLTGIGMMLVVMIKEFKNLKNVKRFVFSKKNASVGIALSVTEVLILSIMVTHLPVTLVWVAMALSGPVLMVMASLLWGEGRWQDQLLVGGISYAAAIPIALSL